MSKRSILILGIIVLILISFSLATAQEPAVMPQREATPIPADKIVPITPPVGEKDQCYLYYTDWVGAWYLGGWYPGDKVAIYFDPMDCGNPQNYPFQLTDVEFALYDFAGVGTIDVRFSVEQAYADSCLGPGPDIYLSPTYTITTFYPDIVHIDFPVDSAICLYEPFFFNLEYMSGVTGSIPSVLFDNNTPVDTCFQWIWYNVYSPPWWEHYDFWSPPPPGWVLLGISGYTGDQTDCPWTNHKMHFPQLPAPGGWDVEFAASRLADDWMCSETGPVTDIHFWISWMQDNVLPIESFVVGIWSNDPVGPDGHSVPDTLLWERHFFPDDFTIIEWSPDLQGWLMPPAGGYFQNDHNRRFQINIEDIQDPFTQYEDTIYWLELDFGTLPYIGWKETDQHWNDDAVIYDFMKWWEVIDPIDSTSIDLAFVITGEVPPCNPPNINCPADESQNQNGVYTTTTQWTADDGNPGNPAINLTSVAVDLAMLPPGISAANVNFTGCVPGPGCKSTNGTVTYTVSDHCQSGGPIYLIATNNCPPPNADTCSFNVALINDPPDITQPDSLEGYVNSVVQYDITGNDPNGDIIRDQASIRIEPDCGTYSITRTAGHGTSSGTWHVSWQTGGCTACITHLVIHDLTDTCQATSYCTTKVHLSEEEWLNHKMHFPQTPRPGGCDVEFNATSLADDWMCSETGPVTDIHFWISWMDNNVQPINVFRVGIWSNNPVGPDGYSVPDILLWERVFFSGDFQIIECDPDTQSWLCAVPDQQVCELQDHTLWSQINITNIEDPFIQQKDAIYWLEIDFGPLPYIGWKETDQNWNDDPVIWYGAKWEEVIKPPPCDNLIDLAFVITGEEECYLGDLGICDTLYVETFDCDHEYQADPGSFDSVRVAMYVTHDSNTFWYEAGSKWVQDSIRGFVVPLTFWHQPPGCADSVILPNWDNWNNTSVIPGHPLMNRSIFRDLVDEHTGDSTFNRMLDLARESPGLEWSTIILDIESHSCDGDSGHAWLAMIPTAPSNRAWWEGSRVLLTTLTFHVYMADTCDTTEIGIDSTFWPPTSYLFFARYDAATYIPRHFLPVKDTIIVYVPPESLYWKPDYDDYAPSGMPDIDQKQDNWHKDYYWTFCGPVAVANCFKWFDAKYNDAAPGAPCDGWDQFPLVRDYTDALGPIWCFPPTTCWDDHSPENMNHPGTPWLFGATPPPPPTPQPFVPGAQPQPSGMPPWGELVERLAWYFDTDGVRTGYCDFSGTYVWDMQAGIDEWFKAETLVVNDDTSTLADSLYVRTWEEPTFAWVETLVEKCQDVILLLGFWEEVSPENWERIGGHYVTVAGINSEEGLIAISDPYYDNAEAGGRGRVRNGTIILPHVPGHGPTDHNDEGNVSHDIYDIVDPSPSPGGLWGLAGYPPGGKSDLSDWMSNFYNQNVPHEFKSVTAPWDGKQPIHTEVEYAVEISPWEYPPDCGDCNGDGTVNIADVVCLVSYLFLGGPPPVKMVKADFNHDGVVTVADVVYLITYLFQNGPLPQCYDP